MEWANLNNKEKSIQLIRILRILSLSDDKLIHNELVFIRQVGITQGLTVEEVDATLISDKQDVLIPESEEERMKLLYYMVFLIKLDRDIDIEEEKTIYHYGFKLGFRKELLDTFITLAKKYIHSGIPVQEMLSKVKQYLN